MNCETTHQCPMEDRIVVIVTQLTEQGKAISRIEGMLDNGIVGRVERIETRLDAALDSGNNSGTFSQRHGMKIGIGGLSAGVTAVIFELLKLMNK